MTTAMIAQLVPQPTAKPIPEFFTLPSPWMPDSLVYDGDVRTVEQLIQDARTGAMQLTPEARQEVIYQHLAHLLKGKVLKAGKHEYAWDGTRFLESDKALFRAVQLLMHTEVLANGETLPPIVAPIQRITNSNARSDAELEAFSLSIAVQDPTTKKFFKANSPKPFVSYERSTAFTADAAITGLVKQLQAVPGTDVDPAALNAEPNSLVIGNVQVYLEDGGIRWAPATPASLNNRKIDTQLPPSEVGMALWETTLEQIFPDPEVRRCLQVGLAASLIDGNTEQKLWFLVGNGSNGKSLFLSAIMNVLKDYIGAIPSTLLQPGNSSQHPTHMGAIINNKIAIGSELKQQVAIDTAVLKSLVSSEGVAFRGLYEDFRTETPKATPFISTNFEPRISFSDPAFFRWLLIVPFNFKFVDDEGQASLPDGTFVKDPQLLSRILEEPAAIVQWLLDGWDEYSKNGLQIPDSIRAKVADSMSMASPFSAFAAEIFEVTNKRTDSIPPSAAFQLWDKWKTENTSNQRLRPNQASDMKQLAEELRVEYQPAPNNKKTALILGLKLTEAGETLASRTDTILWTGPLNQGQRWIRDIARKHR